MIRVAAYSFVVGFFPASRGSRLTSVLGTLAWLAMALGGPAPGSAQTGDSLVVRGPDDSSLSLPVGRLRGYATVPHEALRQLGWAIEVDPPRLHAQLGSDGPLRRVKSGFITSTFHPTKRPTGPTRTLIVHASYSCTARRFAVW